MKTQKFMGKGKLIKRLSIRKTPTKKGEKRNDMTARQRAIDRAFRKSGRPKSDYKYDRKANSATLKG